MFLLSILLYFGSPAKVEGVSNLDAGILRSRLVFDALTVTVDRQIQPISLLLLFERRCFLKFYIEVAPAVRTQHPIVDRSLVYHQSSFI